ncbi:DoxX family protein [Hanstruepera ponticola]|uniref:DoxX family protein n=1 Tax=Hanstruepera ponticola TaxID=2042995 RepID=UPI000CF1BF2F|nr:DoxX family protein [Hanstruepera ponticola]
MILSREYRANWNTLSKIVFRFVFNYFVLYILFTFSGGLFQTVIKWVGSAILGIDYDYDISGYGSGDNTFSYVKLFSGFLLSILLTTLWSIVDRKRPTYNALLYWFVVLLRIYLIYFMLVYGFVKVFKSQFPYPSLSRMLQPLNEFSPMGLAWTYMGYSNGFNIFTGSLEVIAGLLLIPKRTQTLGALMVAGVMMHVTAMNFMFDIPVKIFSVHLVLMALFIFSLDSKRFLNVFLFNKPSESIQYFRPNKEPLYNKITFWIKTVLLVLVLLMIVPRGISSTYKWGDKREKPFLYGIWETTYFIKNKDTMPPLLTDTERWRYLIIDYKDRATIKTMTDEMQAYNFIIDSTQKKISVFKRESDSLKNNFIYKNQNKYFLELEGIINNDTLHIIFNRINHEAFQLNSRGFNWINERPFNR